MLRSDFGTSLLSHADVGPLIVQKLTRQRAAGAGRGDHRPGSSRCRSACSPASTTASLSRRADLGLSLLGIAVPAFWAGLLLATVFAIQLRLLPAGGFVEWSENPLGARHVRWSCPRWPSAWCRPPC